VAVSVAVSVAVCGSTASAAPADSNAAPGELLGHAGRFLTDSAGQVVIVHGLNMVSKVAPYEPAAMGFGAVAARSLAANGFDVVRLGVIYSALEPEPGVLSSAYVSSIEDTVSTLERAGVYTLLDFHQDQLSDAFGGEGFPAWSVEADGLPIRKTVFPLGYTSNPALNAAFHNFWSDRSGPGGIDLQTRYAAAWRFVAARFADNPWVLGYDLFNEPWPANASTQELGAFYSRVIAAIRTVDRRHLIFYEPFVLFNFGAQTELPKFSDPNLGMSFHDYCQSNPATDVTACATDEQLPVTNAVARSLATGDALVETEFGATDDLADLGRVKGIADGRGISWIEWSYCGCHDPTGTIPPSVEGLVSDPALPATGTNVNRSKLDVLSEPYPQLTSGTPEHYAYDETTHTMLYAYTLISPRGHRFTAGSCTAIVVPAVQYPTGYAVTVDGARVTSRPGSGLVTLAEDGAGNSDSSVTVEIRPAASGHVSAPAGSALAACR
jgi:endoglycosylceramidase